MTALTQTHVIEGKPAMSAEAMRAMVLAGGHDLQVVETTGAVCTMRARRRGTETWTTLQWTIDMARAAGVAGKNVWKSYPRQMLQARCTTELVRLVFPDVIHGFRSTEELDDLGEAEAEALPEGGDAQPRTRVTRKRAAKKAAPSRPAPVEQGGRPSAPAGPPLPGEAGYEDPAPAPQEEQGADEQVSAGETAEGEGEATDAAEPADTDQPGQGQDVVDGEVVEEELPDEPPPPPATSTRAQHRMLFATLEERFGVQRDDAEERHLIVGAVAGRALTSFNDLTKAEASRVIDTLAKVPDRAALDALLDEIDGTDQ